MDEKLINRCIFCEKDLSNEKFREDYILLPWSDDPKDKASFNKIAKCSHKECFKRFIELNFQEVKEILFNLINFNK